MAGSAQTKSILVGRMVFQAQIECFQACLRDKVTFWRSKPWFLPFHFLSYCPVGFETFHRMSLECTGWIEGNKRFNLGFGRICRVKNVQTVRFLQGLKSASKMQFLVWFCKNEDFRVFRPKAALFYVHWELSELVFVRASVKKEQFLYWLQFEKQNEIGRVNVPSTWIYKYIDLENVFWLQKDFDALCFESTIFVSDIRILQWRYEASLNRYIRLNFFCRL